MKSYYARKNIHVQKLAMLLHFSEVEFDKPEDCNMTISLECCDKALQILNEAEKLMHLAISFDGKNPLSKLSKDIVKYLKENGATSLNDLLVQFWEDAKKEETEEALSMLITFNQVEAVKDHLGRTTYKAKV
jgi:hypothetical protein